MTGNADDEDYELPVGMAGVSGSGAAGSSRKASRVKAGAVQKSKQQKKKPKGRKPSKAKLRAKTEEFCEGDHVLAYYIYEQGEVAEQVGTWEAEVIVDVFKKDGAFEYTVDFDEEVHGLRAGCSHDPHFG